MAKNWGQPLANSQLEIESLSPATHKQLNSANNHAGLEVNPSPVKCLDETLVLDDTLI